MQTHNNKTFRNDFTRSIYVDDFVEEFDDVKELKDVGINTYPRDENDVFVPTDKNTPYNLEMVEKTINKAYGLKKE